MIYISVRMPVEIIKEEGVVVAISPRLNIGSQGETTVEALLNAKEALELYFEENDEEDQDTQ